MRKIKCAKGRLTAMSGYSETDPCDVENLPYKILECNESLNATTKPRDNDPPFRSLREIGVPTPSEGVVVYFSRHGESEYNVQDRIGGNPKLTPRGSLYAKTLGQYFTNNYKIRIWTSSLLRTIMSAACVKSIYARERTHLLNELHSGYFDGLTYAEIEAKFPEDTKNRKNDKLRYRYPGGESYLDCCARVEPFLVTLERYRNSANSKDDELLIISHQAVLRCIFGYLLNLPSEKIPYIVIPQHTIIKVTYSGGCNVVEYVRIPIEHVDKGINASDMQE